MALGSGERTCWSRAILSHASAIFYRSSTRINSDDEKYTINMDALDFAKAYINDSDEIAKLAAGIAAQHGDKRFSRDGVERQVVRRISLISCRRELPVIPLG
ncbi:MAG: hypothetical protein MZV65_19775 [Chromatiales bacterium]|nr:hypothetical protein [Chromatiales bacterium]